jgi:hypothetical protein
METKRAKILEQYHKMQSDHYDLRMHLNSLEKTLWYVKEYQIDPSWLKKGVYGTADIYEYAKRAFPVAQRKKINFKSIKEIFIYFYNDRKKTHDKIKKIKKELALIKKQLNAMPIYHRCPNCTGRKVIGTKCPHCRGQH